MEEETKLKENEDWLEQVLKLCPKSEFPPFSQLLKGLKGNRSGIYQALGFSARKQQLEENLMKQERWFEFAEKR